MPKRFLYKLKYVKLIFSIIVFLILFSFVANNINNSSNREHSYYYDVMGKHVRILWDPLSISNVLVNFTSKWSDREIYFKRLTMLVGLVPHCSREEYLDILLGDIGLKKDYRYIYNLFDRATDVILFTSIINKSVQFNRNNFSYFKSMIKDILLGKDCFHAWYNFERGLDFYLGDTIAIYDPVKKRVLAFAYGWNGCCNQLYPEALLLNADLGIMTYTIYADENVIVFIGGCLRNSSLAGVKLRPGIAAHYAYPRFDTLITELYGPAFTNYSSITIITPNKSIVDKSSSYFNETLFYSLSKLKSLVSKNFKKYGLTRLVKSISAYHNWVYEYGHLNRIILKFNVFVSPDRTYYDVSLKKKTILPLMKIMYDFWEDIRKYMLNEYNVQLADLDSYGNYMFTVLFVKMGYQRFPDPLEYGLARFTDIDYEDLFLTTTTIGKKY